MTPTTAYRRLNKIIWLGRLPAATVKLVDDESMPARLGTTVQDRVCIHPVIFLNASQPWGETLVHEMLHVAEPLLQHGPTFNLLVKLYWQTAIKTIKGLRNL